MNVGVIGAGTVGSTVAIKLHERGHKISAVASNTWSKAEELAQRVGAEVRTSAQVVQEVQIILLATPDRVIGPLVQELQAHFHPGQVAVHFSGSLSSAILGPARLQGAKVLSVHPLQSFASVEVALATMPGAHFAVEGDDLEFGTGLVLDLGGIPHRISSEGKTLYHAGACIASNYLVVLADLAVKLFESAGFEAKEALRSLLPLMNGTLANLEKVGLPGALTGPISRGDSPVVAGHLQKLPEGIAEVYSQLGLWAVEIAGDKGSLANKEELKKILCENKPG